jgi:hypothetical protein
MRFYNSSVWKRGGGGGIERVLNRLKRRVLLKAENKVHLL